MRKSTVIPPDVQRWADRRKNRRPAKDQEIWDLKGYPLSSSKAYEWKTVEVTGEKVSPDVMRDYREGGWKPVAAKSCAPLPVMFLGCQLMERPKKLHEEAVKETYDYAKKCHLEALSISDTTGDAPYVLTNWGWVPTPLWRQMEKLHEMLDESKAKLWLLIEQGE